MSRKMKIGIDARMIQHSGIGTYLRNLLTEIRRLKPDFAEFILYGDPEALGSMEGIFRIQNFSAPIYSMAEQAGYFTATGEVDLWHSPHFNIPLVCRSGLVATVHDLIPFIFAGKFFFGLKKAYMTVAMKRIASQARLVIAVSKSTARDLTRYFNVPEDKIRVIHEGVSEDFRRVTDESTRVKIRGKYGLPPAEKFLLYVGLIKPHKNLTVLIQAVRRLRQEGKLGEKLLILGPKSPPYPRGYEGLSQIHSDKDLIYLDGADYEDLPVLYSMASIFILPSLYEGFGLPVVEAFACGTPVIISDRASLPEVAGDAALKFMAESEDSLCEAIMKLSRDGALRQQMIEKGMHRAGEFSWLRMARETLSVYEEALKH